MFQSGYMRAIIALVGISAIVSLLAYAHLSLTEARYVGAGPTIITVTGEGEVFAKPDIATFSFGVSAEGDDASTAQERSAEAVNAIMDALLAEGIEEKDIKTEYYNLNPRYEYLESVCNTRGFCPPGERVLRGYEVNQTIRVKVRDTERAGSFISSVGALGATNISSLQFTIDDEDTLQSEARELAIADAEEKIVALADDLGVRVVRMVGFGENGAGIPSYYGRGGDMMESAALSMDDGAVSPTVPTGENTITSNVSVSYLVE